MDLPRASQLRDWIKAYSVGALTDRCVNGKKIYRYISHAVPIMQVKRWCDVDPSSFTLGCVFFISFVLILVFAIRDLLTKRHKAFLIEKLVSELLNTRACVSKYESIDMCQEGTR